MDIEAAACVHNLQYSSVQYFVTLFTTISRYQSRNVRIILYVSVLDAGYAASAIAVFSMVVM